MSFDIYLIPSTASPPEAEFERKVSAAIDETGATNRPGDMRRTSDGLAFDLYELGELGSCFQVRGVTPGLCRMVFEAALRTNAYVVTAGGGNFPAWKIEGMAGDPPGDIGDIEDVADLETLSGLLAEAMGGWRNYVGGSVKVSTKVRWPGVSPRAEQG